MSRLRRRHRHERGFALAIAIIIAVLYFAMIELLMIDSSRELAQARQFRAKVVAQTLAENGAELAAVRIVDPAPSPSVTAEDWQGKAYGTARKGMLTTDSSGATQQSFVLSGTGEAKGLVKSRATVTITGRIENGSRVLIDYTQHSQ